MTVKTKPVSVTEFYVRLAEALPDGWKIEEAARRKGVTVFGVFSPGGLVFACAGKGPVASATTDKGAVIVWAGTTAEAAGCAAALVAWDGAHVAENAGCSIESDAAGSA